ncbi:MAG: ABC transporter permease [Proteobacteria bacterium]|nr:ABC transporter permease [Pseudomonadota bacterium]
MRYEVQIGWRYLYAGTRDRAGGLMLLLAGGGIVAALVGILVLWRGSSDLADTVGTVMVLGGILATVVFGLLSIFSVFTAVSVLGVAFGVAALTIVLAVTTGFQQQFREKVLGVNAHVIVTEAQGGVYTGFPDVIEAAKNIDPDVIAVQPFVLSEMLATRGKGQLSGVLIKGIDPKLVRDVLDLQKHMIDGGSVDALAARCAPDDKTCLSPIIMGIELARKLHAKVGDRLTVVVPLSNIDIKTLQASAPKTHFFRVAGIFHSGFDEYDRRLMYAAIEDLAADGNFVAAGVEMKVRDISRAADIAAKLDRALIDGNYKVQDWYALNENLFTALKLQKVVLVILLTLIIIVAAVNMVSALTMMVTDKTREVAIMKSMGATSGSVAQIFQVVGIAIGGVGTLAGVSLGLAVCHVAGRFGFHLDPTVYLIDRLPIQVRPFEVLLVAGITMVISVVATIWPAASASAMRPVEGLRYD